MKTFKISYKWQEKDTPNRTYWVHDYTFFKAANKEDALLEFEKNWTNNNTIFEIISTEEC